jgi:hypothetical protein
MCTHTDTYIHTHTRSIWYNIYMYIYISILFLNFMLLLLFFFQYHYYIKTDFDEKNTKYECAFRHNLSMFDIHNTHMYTIVTIFKKTKISAIVSLSLHYPYGFIYISNSATPNVVRAKELDK